MAAPKQPDFWIEFTLVPYPVAAGTVYRWSTRPLAWPAWVEGRVSEGWGAVSRALTDYLGNYSAGSFQFGIEDSDGLVRGLLDGATTRYFSSQEAALKLLSAAGRRAGLTPRVVMRGPVAAPVLAAGKRAEFTVNDALGAVLDRPVAKYRISREDFPDCPAENVGRVIPLIYGEHSDYGAEAVDGGSAEKGLIPAIYVGSRTTDETSPFSTPSYLTAPTASAVVNGVAGTTYYYYGVTAHSPYGQTTLGPVVTVTTGPALLTSTNNITLTWTAVSGAVAYTVYGRQWATPVRKLRTVTEATYTDTGQDGEALPPPPSVNTAIVRPAEVTEPDTDFVWDLYVVALGVVEIKDIYCSDMATGTAPARFADPFYMTGGTDFCTPKTVAGSVWPHAEPYLVIGGKRLTVFYGRGPRSQHHKDGVVTIAVSVCGYEDVGDGSGTMIDGAFPVLQHLLNEHVFKSGGAGYADGDWGPLETFSDGTAMLQTTTFAAAQATTVGFVGGTGYRAAFCVADDMTLAELLRRFCVSFTAFVGVNQHGQVVAAVIDDQGALTAGTLYREQVEIRELPPATIADQEIENRWVYRYDYDTDAQAYRGDDETLEDLDSQAAYQRLGVREVTLELWCTRHRETARDAIRRRARHRAVAPLYQPVVVDLKGMEDDLGDVVRLTHREGLGASGYAERQFFVVRHELEPTLPHSRVTLLGMDLGRIRSLPPLPVAVEVGSSGEGTDGEALAFRLGSEGASVATSAVAVADSDSARVALTEAAAVDITTP